MSYRRVRGINRRTFLKGVTLTGSAAFLGLHRDLQPAEPPPETTRIKIIQTFSMCEAPQFVAEELLHGEGFTNVDYVKRDGPYDIADVLASGEVDISFHFAARLIVRLDRGEPITVLAGGHPGCYELFTARPMRTLRDLKGGTVAIRAIGGPEHVFLTSMAAYVGLDPRKDIAWVTYPAATSIELLAQGKIDAFMGFPPQPQDLRAKKIGHILVNSNLDRPWSQYYCCMVAAHRPFVQKHPIATKRALRAILKATDICALEPDGASRLLVDRGRTPNYDLMRQVLKDIAYNKWREYDPEDTMRFYALLLHEVGMIKKTPNQIIAQGTDWRFFQALKKELKN